MAYLPNMQMKRNELSLSYILFCLILGLTYSYVVPSVNSGAQIGTELIGTSVAVAVTLAIVFVVLFVILIIYKRRLRQSSKLCNPVPVVETVEMQNPTLRLLPQPLQNNQEFDYVIPVDGETAPDELGYVIPAVDGGTAPDELGYVIPVDGRTAPDELGYLIPVDSGTAPDELGYVIPVDSGTTPDDVIPVDGGTMTNEEIQISVPSGYSELHFPVDRETINAGDYQKLLKRESGYVLPAEPPPVYEDVEIIKGR
ncbi:Hypothetical predicted protein [Paramuricea clavata]|uniref:Uncharacterized protein n=1 Tax=Paramuricea clavata TaxID=317549 RepID=A0A7D9DMP7_PARCT|nr:Hypothetical predicted protein [Paramuricea clavata]